MGKILFWLLLILGAMILARLLASHKLQRKATPAPQRARQGGPGSTNEPMVRCAHCHIYLPRSDALLKSGETWCCADHARLGKRPEKR